MKKIELPPDEILPLDRVATGVIGLRLLFVDLYAIADAVGWTLVDSGLNGSLAWIRRWAREHFGEAPARAILLMFLSTRTMTSLLIGDAFCRTTQESFFAVATQRPELHGPPAYFTTDWDAARESVRRRASLRPAFLGPGHGRPMAVMRLRARCRS